MARPATHGIGTTTATFKKSRPDRRPATARTVSRSSEKSMVTTSFLGMVWSWRFAIALLLHFSHIVGSLPRFSLAIAMICMVQSPGNMTQVGDSHGNASLVSSNETSFEQMPSSKEFTWDSEVVGLLLAAPNFIQFIGPFTSDLLRRLVGNKYSMAFFLLSGGVTSFLAPTAARAGPYFLLGIAMYQGILRATNAPVIGDMLAHWSPASEKLTLSAFVFVGANVAGVFGNLFSGFLCAIPIDNGWPFIFYFTGALSVIWVTLWMVLVSKSPEDHPFISEEEKQFIVANRIGMANISKKERPPYRAIFTSGPVLGYVIVGTCFIWVMTSTFAYLPMFYNKAQGFSEQQTGVMMSAIGVMRIIGNFLWAALGNKLKATKRFSTNQCRKICIISGMTGAALLQFLNCALITWADRWVVFGVQCLVFICDAVGSSTLTVMPLDMAPRYASFLSALWLTTATMVSISGPLLIGYITPTNSLEEWRVVWIIFGSVFLTGAVAYLVLGQSSLQPWAIPADEKKKNGNPVDPAFARKYSVAIEAPPKKGSAPKCPAPKCPAPKCPAPKCPAPKCPVPKCPAPKCPADVNAFSGAYQVKYNHAQTDNGHLDKKDLDSSNIDINAHVNSTEEGPGSDRNIFIEMNEIAHSKLIRQCSGVTNKAFSEDEEKQCSSEEEKVSVRNANNVDNDGTEVRIIYKTRF